MDSLIPYTSKIFLIYGIDILKKRKIVKYLVHPIPITFIIFNIFFAVYRPFHPIKTHSVRYCLHSIPTVPIGWLENNHQHAPENQTNLQRLFQSVNEWGKRSNEETWQKICYHTNHLCCHSHSIYVILHSNRWWWASCITCNWLCAYWSYCKWSNLIKSFTLWPDFFFQSCSSTFFPLIGCLYSITSWYNICWMSMQMIVIFSYKNIQTILIIS